MLSGDYSVGIYVRTPVAHGLRYDARKTELVFKVLYVLFRTNRSHEFS